MWQPLGTRAINGLEDMPSLRFCKWKHKCSVKLQGVRLSFAYNVEQSIRLLQNDAQSYITMHACSFKLEEWRPFYPE